MSADFALDFSGDPVPCDFPGCVLDLFHDGDHVIGVEVVEKHFREAGISTKRKNGDLYVRCTDATFAYLTGPRPQILAPVACTCAQRPYPHELSVHNAIRFESRAMRWPWSLRFAPNMEAP
jgi:hypothetical protein